MAIVMGRALILKPTRPICRIPVLPFTSWMIVLVSYSCCKNNKKFSVIKQNMNSYSCGGQKSEIGLRAKIKVLSKAVFLVKAVEGIQFLGFFSFYRLPTSLGSWPLPDHSNLLFPSSHFVLLPRILLPPSYNDLCDYIGPTQTIQNNFLILRSLITPAKSFAM